jgi:cytochrome bd-type quinol oxidase subunit 1
MDEGLWLGCLMLFLLVLVLLALLSGWLVAEVGLLG